MVIEQFTSRDALLQAAKLLQRQVLTQQRTIARLKARLAKLEGASNPEQLELEYLKEQIDLLNTQLYAATSERRHVEQAAAEAPPGEPQTGHGPTPQPLLPVVDVVHELAEEEKTCEKCGGTLEPIPNGDVVTEEIHVVEVSYEIRRHHRTKYACRCEETIKVAPGPKRLIPGGRYSNDFAVHVAARKYLEHMPLERQVASMARAGLQVGSQTLWDQIDALAKVLEPTYEALCAEVLESGVVHADETHWRLMGRKNETSRWWVWSVVSDTISTYRIVDSRSSKVAQKLLGGYEGIVVVDGYGAYRALERDGPRERGPTLAFCWAHVRRKFIKAERMEPRLAKEFLDLIGSLYAIEKTLPRVPGEGVETPERERVLAERLRIRRERSQLVVNEIFRLAQEKKGSLPQRSTMGKAIAYLLKLRQGLGVFLDNPRVPLDNNHAERALRGVVVGRKNHYGSRSKRGTRVAAIFYTLFETAKLSGIDPARYVTRAMERALETPGRPTLPTELA
jgi:transposase